MDSNSLVINSKKLKKEVKGNSTKESADTVEKKLEKLKELYQKNLLLKMFTRNNKKKFWMDFNCYYTEKVIRPTIS